MDTDKHAFYGTIVNKAAVRMAGQDAEMAASLADGLQIVCRSTYDDGTSIVATVDRDAGRVDVNFYAGGATDHVLHLRLQSGVMHCTFHPMEGKPPEYEITAFAMKDYLDRLREEAIAADGGNFTLPSLTAGPRP